ncbi:hypothetical protein V3C99_004542 [Haemonchus contortus]|uniref:Activin_recp domain-containing protein n=1 Tax=Haemonchus contortus TaxID=6289 RepID=A0A7I5E606_HAECO|nr:Hypothetical protein CBG12211 [Haemonchus contortus]
MIHGFAISFLIFILPTSSAIECYTGLKLIAGQSVGTDTIQCDNSGAYCYNMSANAAAVIDIVKVGCSLWRCMFARDKCISTTFQNIPISLCCCSTNLCNVPENRGIRHQNVQGWNAQPDRVDRERSEEHIEHYSKQQMAQLLEADLDDDTLNSTHRSHRYAGLVPEDSDLLNSTLRHNNLHSQEIQIP